MSPTVYLSASQRTRIIQNFEMICQYIFYNFVTYYFVDIFCLFQNVELSQIFYAFIIGFCTLFQHFHIVFVTSDNGKIHVFSLFFDIPEKYVDFCHIFNIYVIYHPVKFNIYPDRFSGPPPRACVHSSPP